ncbi:TPA: hypothetical protein PC598_000184 [Morganella morganii]|nr:hypothetical protein [Morganella morganii]
MFYLTAAFEADDLAYELRTLELEHAKRVLKELYDEAGTTVVIVPMTAITGALSIQSRISSHNVYYVKCNLSFI